MKDESDSNCKWGGCVGWGFCMTILYIYKHVKYLFVDFMVLATCVYKVKYSFTQISKGTSLFSIYLCFFFLLSFLYYLENLFGEYSALLYPTNLHIFMYFSFLQT